MIQIALARAESQQSRLQRWAQNPCDRATVGKIDGPPG
jgi:hypothetical protein